MWLYVYLLSVCLSAVAFMTIQQKIRPGASRIEKIIAFVIYTISCFAVITALLVVIKIIMILMVRVFQWAWFYVKKLGGKLWIM